MDFKVYKSSFPESVVFTFDFANLLEIDYLIFSFISIVLMLIPLNILLIRNIS